MLRLAVPDLVSNSYFPAAAAVELGFFKKEGLEVSLELMFPVDRSYRALRDREIDIVAGSAHSAAAAFPNYQGAKLLCSQAQGMYWFLVMHSDLGVARGDLSALRGKRIGAAPWVDLGLRGLLIEAGLDPAKNDIDIVPVPSPPTQSINFGLNAARALQDRQIDGFWANGMAAEVATLGGFGSVVLDVRRGEGPPAAFGFTFASIVVRDDLVSAEPECAGAIVRAIVGAQDAMKADPSLATRVGLALFPRSEAELIARLIERDLPYYDHRIRRETIAQMSEFLRRMSLTNADLDYDDVVAAGTSAFQKARP
jgi:ABC-type nitrate/sulfonate/bicarbonate transport system substrate-binding protein